MRRVGDVELQGDRRRRKVGWCRERDLEKGKDVGTRTAHGVDLAWNEECRGRVGEGRGRRPRTSGKKKDTPQSSVLDRAKVVSEMP